MRMRRAAILALSAGAILATPAAALASSHREAPFVTKNPKTDGTDFYMFNSYETGRAGYVTIIANYQPLQDAYGGPNYFQMDPDALYEIEIDNTGDGVEDLTFQFQFNQTLTNLTVNPNPGSAGGTPDAGGGIALVISYPDGGSAQTVHVPFLNVGPIPANLNVTETYTAGVVAGPRRGMAASPISAASGGATTFTTPADYIGPHSFGATTATAGAAAYAAYASQYNYDVNIPNCSTPAKMFVGQRAEGFAVNLGPIFDLIDAPAAVVTGTMGPQVVPNPLAKKNVTSIALEVPASCLVSSATQPVIAGWTTASVRQVRIVNPGATYTVPSKEGGAWTQVSRLGMPLVNEVVIGLPDKDHFNASEPSGDAQFVPYITNPTLAKVIDIVFMVGLEPQLFPRTDLVTAFAEGVPGVNAFPAPVTPFEALRLNTTATTIFTPRPAAMQSYLGAAGCFVKGVLTPTATGCDPTGFPNGRRPGDDVVDIALDVMEGYLIPATAPGGLAPAYAGATPTLFTDGVQQIATQFGSTFPYLNTPNAGANGDGT